MNLRKFEEIGHPGLCDIEMWLMLMPKWKVRIVCQENAILRYTVSEGCVCVCVCVCVCNDKNPTCSPVHNYQKLLCRRQQSLRLRSIRHFFLVFLVLFVDIISNYKSNVSLRFLSKGCK